MIAEAQKEVTLTTVQPRLQQDHYRPEKIEYKDDYIKPEITLKDYWDAATFKEKSIVVYELLSSLIIIARAQMNNDKMTTWLGIAKAIAIILGLIGISVNPDDLNTIMYGIGALYSVLTAIQGYFTNKSEAPNVK